MRGKLNRSSLQAHRAGRTDSCIIPVLHLQTFNYGTEVLELRCQLMLLLARKSNLTTGLSRLD
jgi:hypothetical protein